jgi:Cu-processing system ATP-binding protein
MNKALKTLSGGTRQKVNAVLTLMFDSRILIFDEATVGLDPVSRLKFRKYLLHEKASGKTIILVSHFINEVEELADDVIFILEGSIFYQGSLADLKARGNGDNLETVIAEMLEKSGNTSSSYV